MGFVCATCGEYHEDVPRGFGWRVPDLLAHLSEAELDTDDVGEGNWIVIDESCVGKDDGGRENFFVKGNIEIPVRGEAEPFVLTVWTTLAEETFWRAFELWQDPRRVAEPPYFGWLQNMIPGYPPTANIETSVHWQEPGVRPLVRVDREDHPLAREQREGIPAERADELTSILLHFKDPPD